MSIEPGPAFSVTHTLTPTTTGGTTYAHAEVLTIHAERWQARIDVRRFAANVALRMDSVSWPTLTQAAAFESALLVIQNGRYRYPEQGK